MEKEIPLKEFGSKSRNKEEDEDKSDLEDDDLEKVVSTDLAEEEREVGETSSWGWEEMLNWEKTGQEDEDSLEEVVTIPSKSGGKEVEKVKWGQQETAANEDLEKVKVRNIVLNSLGELKNNAPTQEWDIPSDSSSLEEVCTIPNFIDHEEDVEKWATADEESDDEEKAEEIVQGYSGENMRDKVNRNAPSHDSSEVPFKEICTIPPSFIDEKETEKGQKKVEDDMSFSQEEWSSSDSSRVSLEEIPSNFINEGEEETHEDAIRNQNLETIEDEESCEENAIIFPPEEQIEEMDEIPLDDANGEETISGEREPKLSFYAVVRLIVAVRRLREKSKVNPFAWAFLPLHVVLYLGYYFLVVPFKIVGDKDGKFKLHVNLWQMSISIFVLLLVFIRQIRYVLYFLKYVSLQAPDFILLYTESVLATLMIVAYLFIIGCKRAGIIAVFEKFDLQMAASLRAYEGRKFKLILLTLLPMLYYIGVANWRAWGNAINIDPDKGWGRLFSHKVDVFGLPINNDSKSYFMVVLIVTLLAEYYYYFFMFYMNILMWSASIAVFCIVRQADHLFGRKGCFNLKKDSNLFKVIVEIIKKVSAMIGPIIVMFCLDVIPYTIYFIFWITKENLNSVNGWLFLFDVSIKLGHICIACSASSNGSKLVKKIDELIDREPVEIFQIPHGFRSLRMMIQWNGLINEFTRMTAEPISLTGMDLFVINAQFLGAVTLAVLTNGLLYAQWVRDTEPVEPAQPTCTCICPAANVTCQ